MHKTLIIGKWAGIAYIIYTIYKIVCARKHAKNTIHCIYNQFEQKNEEIITFVGRK